MAENKVFESIMNGLTESLEYAKGDSSKARRTSVTIAELPKYHDKEIKQIREDLNLTQKNFAFVLGVSPKTVEAWEAAEIFREELPRVFYRFFAWVGRKCSRNTMLLP